jgi:phosphatidylglycerophosphate synthase
VGDGVFIAAMTTDWLDGRVARRRGHVSPLGSLLDSVADKLLVLSVLIVLVDPDIFPGWMWLRSSRGRSSSRGFAWPRSNEES